MVSKKRKPAIEDDIDSINEIFNNLKPCYGEFKKLEDIIKKIIITQKKYDNYLVINGELTNKIASLEEENEVLLEEINDINNCLPIPYVKVNYTDFTILDFNKAFLDMLDFKKYEQVLDTHLSDYFSEKSELDHIALSLTEHSMIDDYIITLYNSKGKNIKCIIKGQSKEKLGKTKNPEVYFTFFEFNEVLKEIESLKAFKSKVMGLLQTLVKVSVIPLYSEGLDGQFEIFGKEKFKELTGYPSKKFHTLKSMMETIFNPELFKKENYQDEIENYFKNKLEYKKIAEINMKDGGKRYIELELIPQEQTKLNRRIYGIITDVTKMSLSATTDHLTGLLNRGGYDKQLNLFVKAKNRNNDSYLTGILLDADGLKSINDNYGHDAGDMLIKRIADILSVYFKRETDLIARRGGDEFGILLPGFDQTQTIKLLNDFGKSLYEPFEYNNCKIDYVSLSIGFYTSKPGEIITPDDFIKNCDIALYHVKGTGRFGYADYNNLTNPVSYKKLLKI